MSLRGKKIWLVGASAGIGRALAVQLAEQGAVLGLSARNAEALAELKALLPGKGHLILPCDVQSEPSVDAAFADLMVAWRRFDILIYNAGFYEPMTAQTFNLAIADAMIDVNLRGAMRVLKGVLPAMLSVHQGHIALVGSIAGYRGMPAAIGYGASKAGLIHLAENLACDLAGAGVRVQVINPGFVKTRLTDKNDFAMPEIMTAEQAAHFIVSGLESSKFEIRFPWKLSTILKLLRFFPAWLYFGIMRRGSA